MADITPGVTQLYGLPLPTRRRAFAIAQSQSSTVQLQFFNNQGNPADLLALQDSEDDPSCKCRMREVISTCRRDLHSVDGTVDDAEQGLVTVSIPSAVAATSGVYNLEVVARRASDNSIFISNTFYLWVDRGLFNDNSRFKTLGPPTVDECRLYLRDSAPEENRLLDDLEFDLAELCQSTEMAVRVWNESQPPIDLYFDTRNYPPRDRWLQAIAGKLLQMAAHRFRRNHLPYQSAGLSIDDQNKFQQYDQAGLSLLADYREWVKQKKTQINCEMAITSSVSDYSGRYHGNSHNIWAY